MTIAYLVVVGWVTLGPGPLDGEGSAVLSRLLRVLARSESTSWITYARVEFLSNVLMFVPIGVFFLMLFGRRLFLVAILAGVCLTVGIETAQLFLPGRVSDVRDLAANSAGTLIGVSAALILTTPAALRMRRARPSRGQPTAR